MNMRKIILSIITAVAFATGFAAETYTPLVREGVEWGYITRYQTHTSNQRLRFYGREIINGKEYHKLVTYTTYNGDDKTLIAWMREEDKKVYCIYPPSARGYLSERVSHWEAPESEDRSEWEEILLYDFNLEKDHPLPGFSNNKCTETGYIDVEGGRRKYWKFDSDWAEMLPDIMIVEGMGPVNLVEGWGASIAVPYHDWPACVPCFSKKDFLLYEREYDAEAGEDLAALQGKTIYKSPLYDKFRAHDPNNPEWGKIDGVEAPADAFSFGMGADGVKVTGAAAELARVKVYDLAGREHMSVSPLDGRVSIPYTLLPAGVAIIRAEAPDGASRSLKVAVPARD